MVRSSLRGVAASEGSPAARGGGGGGGGAARDPRRMVTPPPRAVPRTAALYALPRLRPALPRPAESNASFKNMPPKTAPTSAHAPAKTEAGMSLPPDHSAVTAPRARSGSAACACLAVAGARTYDVLPPRVSPPAAIAALRAGAAPGAGSSTASFCLASDAANALRVRVPQKPEGGMPCSSWKARTARGRESRRAEYVESRGESAERAGVLRKRPLAALRDPARARV